MTIENLPSFEWIVVVQYCGENNLDLVFDWEDAPGRRRRHRVVILSPLSPNDVIAIADAIKAVRVEYDDLGLLETAQLRKEN